MPLVDERRRWRWRWWGGRKRRREQRESEYRELLQTASPGARQGPLRHGQGHRESSGSGEGRETLTLDDRYFTVLLVAIASADTIVKNGAYNLRSSRSGETKFIQSIEDIQVQNVTSETKQCDESTRDRVKINTTSGNVDKHGNVSIDQSNEKSTRSKKKNEQILLEISKNGGIENNLEKVEVQERMIAKGNSSPEAIRSRTSEDIEPREEDYIEAADIGIQAMDDLYLVKEPKLFAMGLFLDADNPARFVAAFNQQRDEAKQLAKFGYATLKAAKEIRKKYPNHLRQAPTPGGDNNKLHRNCPKKGIPQCPPASLRYRTADGSCNNFNEFWWGSAMSTMQRFLPAVYEDDIDSIRKSITGNPLPSARLISNYIHEERDAPLSSVTHMLMQWGQFIDHDITATGQSTAFQGSVPQCCLNNGAGFQPPELSHPDCLPIEVHPQDSRLGRLGVRCLEFVRSGPVPREDCEFGNREQLSQVTSYIDASTVYSSSARQSDSLRIFRNGLLQYGKLQSRRPVLPRDDSDLCKRGSLSTSCFKAGDGRLSEQPALISLHVVFLRLHNRLATQLAALNQHWSDEKIFQESRRIVGAIVQHITYREFLPIVLGHEVMRIFDLEVLRKGFYEGYDESIDPNIANSFATAAYRFGHSLVQHSFVRYDRNHKPIFNNVTIHEEFTNPVNLETAGSVDRLLLGLINQPCQKRDEFITEELTNHLFQTPRFSFGMDLASINIQRGRDHGIPPFVDWREPCSLSPIRNWTDLERIMAPETARKFQEVYAAVEDIDLFSAGLAEKPVVGGLVGPTFACIIAQQFRSLRKGDRFWYENSFVESGFSPPQLQQIRRITLAQILCRTMDNIDTIQPFVMLAPDNFRNKRLTCDDPILDQINLDAWIEKPFQRRESLKSEEKKAVDNLEDEAHIDDNAEAEERSSANKSAQKFSQRNKPVKSTINQQNRITIKRPLGPHENVTIVVNNNAVHSPIFIRDSIYGSNVQFNQFTNSPSSQRLQPENQKHMDSNEDLPTSAFRPKPPKPPQRPQNYPPQSVNPYYPYSFNDPNNPNPPSYGFNAKPPNNVFPSNEFFSYNTPISSDDRPSYGQSFNDLQESYFTTKRPLQPYRPTKPSLQLYDYDQNQQESYFATKRPTFRPTTKSPYAGYNHQVNPGFSLKPEGTYSQNSNRPQQNGYSTQANINDQYLHFEPNESNHDKISLNYRPRPTKKPLETLQNNSNQQYFENQPHANYDSDIGSTHQVRPSNGKPNYGSFKNSDNVPQNPNFYYSSLSDSYNNRPNQKPNLYYLNSNSQPNYENKENLNLNHNLQSEENDRQGPHYLHTHTTISDIKNIYPHKPQRHKIQVDLEIPRPLSTLQNRESIDGEIEISIFNSQLMQNSSQIHEFIQKNKSHDTNNQIEKGYPRKEEIIKDDDKVLELTTLENVFEEIPNGNKTINNKLITSSTASVPEVVTKQTEPSHTTASSELPRPMKLRRSG